MTVLEELKSLALDALEKKPLALSQLTRLATAKDVTDQVRDNALDIVTEALFLYRSTVVEVRALSTLEEVAAKWKETHAHFKDLLDLWNRLNVTLGESSNEAVRYCGEVIAKLERLTRKNYEFHADAE
jgi:hypothetical protein